MTHEHEKTKLEMTYFITGDFFKNPLIFKEIPYDLESQGISIHKSPRGFLFTNPLERAILDLKKISMEIVI